MSVMCGRRRGKTGKGRKARCTHVRRERFACLLAGNHIGDNPVAAREVSLQLRKREKEEEAHRKGENSGFSFDGASGSAITTV